MIDGFGFGAKWRGWIMECLSTARGSVLVNGSPTEEFDMEKGLRQGDPLSPFLFLMVVEGLSGLVKKAKNEGLLHGIEVGKRGLAVSLLQFADDTVFLGRADSGNIFMVKTILRWFELMSGLRINFNKSSLYGFNVSERWIREAAGVLHCAVGVTPFRYLGMLIGGNPRRKKFWDPVVTKFCTKLAAWKSAVLSFGGCLTLLNSLAVNKDSKVKEYGTWEGDSWHWEMKWRRERLPTRWNLQKRGMIFQGDGMKCGLCKEGVEDVNHLFCICKTAWLVWVKVIQWWGLEVVMQDKKHGDFREQLLELIQVECAKELTRYKRSLKIFKQQQGTRLQPDSPAAET
ncbi:hypothetical protein SLEP1_g39346 [Rubroshorea leprosula]|uniref:Reverse transcriptase domain-containing protein n=1 Tax=Rubroshorea leprosula TaxID=152421 RepID=A0AAV5L0A7_9ROSI|nr:hypothetical protein SLEP1_g39346 [Rubroshorea leprosula]